MTQNDTISVEISTIIANLNDKFANKVANKEKYYAQIVPNIVEKIVKLGAENIFYMSQNYRGLYEDDDCTFYYWDNVNGEVISDSWTTAFACPSFNLYTDDILTFSQAKEYGLVDEEKIKEYNINNIRKFINNTTAKGCIDIFMKYNPLIEVTRGRKFKGVGYYITEIEKDNGYYPSTIEAKVLSLSDFQIHYCNPNFIKFVELDSTIEEYIKWANEKIDKVVKNNSYTLLFNTNGVNWTIKGDELSFETYIKNNKVNTNVISLIDNAYDPREEEIKKQRAEKMTQEYANVLKWVKEKTDKTTDSEQIALAIKILNKKY